MVVIINYSKSQVWNMWLFEITSLKHAYSAMIDVSKSQIWTMLLFKLETCDPSKSQVWKVCLFEMTSLNSADRYDRCFGITILNRVYHKFYVHHFDRVLCRFHGIWKQSKVHFDCILQCFMAGDSHKRPDGTTMAILLSRQNPYIVAPPPFGEQYY